MGYESHLVTVFSFGILQKSGALCLFWARIQFVRYLLDLRGLDDVVREHFINFGHLKFSILSPY